MSRILFRAVNTTQTIEDQCALLRQVLLILKIRWKSTGICDRIDNIPILIWECHSQRYKTQTIKAALGRLVSKIHLMRIADMDIPISEIKQYLQLMIKYQIPENLPVSTIVDEDPTESSLNDSRPLMSFLTMNSSKLLMEKNSPSGMQESSNSKTPQTSKNT